MGRNLPDYTTAVIRTVAPWSVNNYPNALYTKQKLQSLRHVFSTMKHQMQSSILGLTTITDRLDTKGIYLILNFPNTTGNQVMTVQYELKRNVAVYASPYKCVFRWYDFCLTENLKFIREDRELLLNKRSELVSKFHHKINSF